MITHLLKIVYISAYKLRINTLFVALLVVFLHTTTNGPLLGVNSATAASINTTVALVTLQTASPQQTNPTQRQQTTTGQRQQASDNQTLQTPTPQSGPAFLRQLLIDNNISQAELIQKMSERGINLQEIPQNRWPQYEDDIIEAVEEILMERNQLDADRSELDENPRDRTLRTRDGQVIRRSDSDMDADDTDAEEEEDPEQRIYGHSIFTTQTLETFITTEGARAPDSYVLGQGDIIRVSIFGVSQANLSLEIDEEGYIQPTGMPKIFLRGVTMREARPLIRERFSGFYTFNPNEFSLVVETTRSVNINIFGETNLNGSFTLSALNSPFNALTVAEGPSEIGSVRNIQFIRNGSRQNIDVYEFMSNPTVQLSYNLQNNDIIFVPVAEKVVQITGAVRRPMRYELKTNESMLDLIRFAGGIRSDAAADYIQIQRQEGGQVSVREWAIPEILNGSQHVDLRDGDVVRVRVMTRTLDKFVEVEGSVYYPGVYDLNQNSSISLLLEKVGLRDQAKTDRIFIERTLPDRTIQIIPVDWESLRAAGGDFQLEPRDRVIINDQERFAQTAILSVEGFVRNPFQRTLNLNDRISVGEALTLAGGLRLTAAQTGFVFRVNQRNRQLIEHIRVDLIQEADFQLQPGDQLYVYSQQQFTDVGEISIYGMVNDPFQTKFESSLTIPEMLRMAGGFQRGAAQNKIEVFRLNLSLNRGTSYEILELEVDQDFNIITAPEEFQLQPFDQVVVRSIPMFAIGQSVEISGQVRYPGIYPLESRRVHLSDLIEQAGGLTSLADRNNAVILRSFRGMGPIAINLEQAMRRRGQERFDPVIFDDDIINIPMFQNTVTILAMGTRFGELQQQGVALIERQEVSRGQVRRQMGNINEFNPDSTLTFFGQRRSILLEAEDVSMEEEDEFMAMLDDEILVPVNVPFQGHRSALWYIENFAGGFAEDADKRSVTVTTVGGQISGTKRVVWFFNDYPTVQPGSTIALRIIPPELGDDDPLFNIERTLERTMQFSTSILTLILIMESVRR